LSVGKRGPPPERHLRRRRLPERAGCRGLAAARPPWMAAPAGTPTKRATGMLKTRTSVGATRLNYAAHPRPAGIVVM
jgi:hypothetical protein